LPKKKENVLSNFNEFSTTDDDLINSTWILLDNFIDKEKDLINIIKELFNKFENLN
jgi:hypothetical protein